MILASYLWEGQLRGAVLHGDTVVDLGTAAHAAALAVDPAPVSVRQALRRGWHRSGPLRRSAGKLAADGHGHRRDDVTLGPPVPDASKVLCVGLNYADHTQEVAFTPPEVPTIFSKFANSLVGPTSDVRHPVGSRQVDYEGELAVVIGTECKSVPVAQAMDVVAGAMVFNDLSARDLQFASPQWTMGKAVDDFAPCGPAIVPFADLPPVEKLRLTTRVNGVVVQDASAGEMVFSIPEVIAFLSRTITLEPGDIIATGTPAGVGMTRTPPLFLHPDDVVEVQIDGIGTIRNRIVAAVPAPAPRREDELPGAGAVSGRPEQPRSVAGTVHEGGTA